MAEETKNEGLSPELATPLEEPGTFSSFMESYIPPLPDLGSTPDPVTFFYP